MRLALTTLLFLTTLLPAHAQDLTIAPIPEDIPRYNRAEWRHWIDEDGDCQSTRHEVLIAESLAPVTYTNARECSVLTGYWIDPYTGQEVFEARALEIDHFIPLANAHRSGGWAWTPEEKQQFANYLDDPAHLVAVTSSANRSKGDKGPEAWWPANEAHWCDYAATWIAVKQSWGLTATEDEWWALSETLRVYCQP
jgi:hypothetical protein